MTQAISPNAGFLTRVAAGLVRRLPVGKYRAMNALANPNAPPFFATTAHDAGGYRFVCHLADSVAREAFFTGRYEPQETALLAALLRPGMTFVDIGANWGYFTLLAASKVGPSGRVVGLEPDPRMFDLLSKNLAANTFPWARAFPVAASDGAGELRFTGFSESGGNWGISTIAGDGSNAFVARCVGTDAFLDELGLGKVDVLKMDIEGAEDLALTGMATGLATGRYPVIVIELHPGCLAKRGKTASALVESLLAAGYSGRLVRHDRAATRDAAYGRDQNPGRWLIPLTEATPLGDWPHAVFCRPPFPKVFGE